MIEDFRIYGVIEISPWRFKNGAEIMDRKTSEQLQDPEVYEELVMEVYKKHGIRNIRGLNKYSDRSIKISEIDDNDLRVLVEVELSDFEISELGILEGDSFEGGLFLEFNDQAITHSCCGAISDYKNWESLIEEKPYNWEEVWIGHPWVYGRVRKNILQLTDYLDETDSKPEEDFSVKYEFNLVKFTKKLNSSIEELKMLKNRIRRMMSNEGNKFSEDIASFLVDKVKKNTSDRT